MGKKTWDMESAINLRIEELKLEYEYWKNAGRMHIEQAKQKYSINPSMDDLILVRIEQDYMDLAAEKMRFLNSKLHEIT